MAKTFVKEIDGQTRQQTAYSPADAVRLRFNGWRELPEASAPAKKPRKRAAATSSGRARRAE
jgi:hypothetical protein